MPKYLNVQIKKSQVSSRCVLNTLDSINLHTLNSSDAKTRHFFLGPNTYTNILLL